MRPYLRCLGPRRYTQKDKQLQKEAGVICLELHGCANCDFVFPPEDEAMLHCPKCQQARYVDVASKKAQEMVYYFPIAERLKALMQAEKFQHSVEYELRRRSNDNFMTDLQDAPAWQEEMGTLPRRGNLHALACFVCCLLIYCCLFAGGIRKLGLVYCSDGVKAFQRGDTSLVIDEFFIGSLPPQERYSPENMLVFMMYESCMPQQKRSKYYDYAMRDLNLLYNRGVPDTRIESVFVLGATLDLEGRYKCMGCQKFNAYYGCTVCYHRYVRGLHKKVIFTGLLVCL